LRKEKNNFLKKVKTKTAGSFLAVLFYVVVGLYGLLTFDFIDLFFPPCIFQKNKLYYIYYGSTNATYASTYGKQALSSCGERAQIGGMLKMQIGSCEASRLRGLWHISRKTGCQRHEEGGEEGEEARKDCEENRKNGEIERSLNRFLSEFKIVLVH